MKFFASLSLGLLVAFVGACATAQPAQAPASLDKHVKTADDIVLSPVPQFPGLQVALIEGNPFEEGFYIMRVKFSGGALSPPHTHDQDRFVTVLEGEWHFGLGPSGSCEGATPLLPGSFAKHPAGIVHYDGACGEGALVQISGFGPVSTDPVETD